MRHPLLLLGLPLLLAAGCTETVVQGPPPPPPPPSGPVYAAEPPPPPPPPAQPDPAPTLSPLDQLCAPIALYPDPLISLVLPAATFPAQIQAAASYLQGGGDPSAVDQMTWDASVKGLSHYATVIEWMGANADWTSQLGGAFASQPAAVMDAIQELRRRAQAAGNLTNTPQQQVVVYQNTVQIVPAQADVIYVPQYDPAVVYVAQPYGYGGVALFGWGRPYAAGVWLSYGFDWRAHAVYTGDWYHYHQMNGGWGRPVNYAQVSVDVRFHASSWQPPRSAPPPPPQLSIRANVAVNVNMQARFAQPRVMAGAPRPPAQAVRIQAMVQNRPTRPAVQAQAQRPAPQPPRAQPPAQQHQAEQQKRQPPAYQTDQQRRQAEAQKAQPARQPQRPLTKQEQAQQQKQQQQKQKQQQKKQPPKKTPEELERERRAQESAQHPAASS